MKRSCALAAAGTLLCAPIVTEAGQPKPKYENYRVLPGTECVISQTNPDYPVTLLSKYANYWTIEGRPVEPGYVLVLLAGTGTMLLLDQKDKLVKDPVNDEILKSEGRRIRQLQKAGAFKNAGDAARRLCLEPN